MTAAWPSRWRFWFRRIAALCLALGLAPAVSALSPEERQALDLSMYTVRDASAGYVDLDARKAYLQQTTDPILQKLIAQLRLGSSCRDALAIPPITGPFLVPGYYEDPAGWREVGGMFLRFEDTVSLLAAAQVVAEDDYHGECLIKVLAKWASQSALEEFVYATDKRQAWFQTESTLFASALAYSIVRDDVEGMAAEKSQIDAWMLRVASRHLSIPGQKGGTCCNNHFYRRAVYASIIGVLNGNDDLFRYGISAVFSAVDEASAAGALPLEMKRGRRAAHYQNFAAMYLVFIAQIAQRQGYDLYVVSKDGKSLKTIADLAVSALSDPASIAVYTTENDQIDDFTRDPQYFGWLELFGRRTEDPRVDDLLAALRPVYNRSLGGYMTLYFHEPGEKMSVQFDRAAARHSER